MLTTYTYAEELLDIIRTVVADLVDSLFMKKAFKTCVDLLIFHELPGKTEIKDEEREEFLQQLYLRLSSCKKQHKSRIFKESAICEESK